MALVTQHPDAAALASEFLDAGYTYAEAADEIFIQCDPIARSVATNIALEVLFARLSSVQQSISRKYAELRDAIADFERIQI